MQTLAGRNSYFCFYKIFKYRLYTVYLRDNNTCALRSCVDLICIGSNKTQYGLSVIWQIQITVQQKEKELK